MAFALKDLKIVPGGLNLLMPGDDPPQVESLDLTDWWPNAADNLEQSPEPQLIFTMPVECDGVLKTGSRIYTSGAGNLYLGGSSIDTGYGAQYALGMISFQGYAWFTSRNKSTRHDGTTLSAWSMIGPPTGPGTGPGVSDYGPGSKFFPVEDSYYFTWVSPVGESNASGVTKFTPPNDGNGHTFAISYVGTPPAGTTGWNIYRQVPGYKGDPTDADTVPYLLNQSPIPIATTSYNDSGDAVNLADDDSLLRFGVILEGDHDPCPLAAIVANQTYNGRIVVANTAQYPNRIYWTPPNEPSYFRGSQDSFGGDWVDVGTDRDDEIRAIVVRPSMLVIYRAKSIWRHQGDLGDPNALLEPACLDVGIAGVRAVASTAAGDYFVGTGGDALYRFNNDWPVKLSQKVEPLLRGFDGENFIGQDVNQTAFACVGHFRGRVYVSYVPKSFPAPTLILHIESQRWFSSSTNYHVFQDCGDQFLGGGYTGLYQVEKQLGNASTSLRFETQYQDCGQPDHEKTWGDLVITHNTQGVTMNLLVRLNKNLVSFTLATFSSTSRTVQIFPMVFPPDFVTVALRGKPIDSLNAAIRIYSAGSTTGLPVVIESPILLHYYLHARRGKTFDTGETRHGLDQVGRIDQVELDIDASAGPANLLVSSDIPGGVMTDRTSGGVAVATTTGRQVQRIQFGTPIDGRLFRHQLSTTTTYRLYGYRVRILPIGVYLDGTNPVADFWYTLPLAPGT